MSTTPSSSPKPKPERSFSLNKIRGALRRGSKTASDGTPNGSSPEPSEGRPSIDGLGTPPSTPPPNVSSTPGSPTPPQRKPSSLRRMSLDVVRPLGRHGRSGSVSFVPPAASEGSATAAAAPTANGTAETKDKEDFDPFSESHDDKSRPRGWRKTVKGALKRTASRLSVSSARSDGKPPSSEDKEGSDAAAAVAAAPSNSSPPAAPVVNGSASQDSAAVDPPAIAESSVSSDSKPSEASKEEEKEKDKAAPAVPLEASTSLDWEHVNTADAEHSAPAAPSVEVTPSLEPEDEDVAEAKNVLAPLNVSSQHLMPLRSEISELSPIMESPLTAVRDDTDMSLMIPIHNAPTPLHPSPLSTSTVPPNTKPTFSIEESYIEVPHHHLSEAAAAAEEADLANASRPPAGAVVVDVIPPSTLKPSASADPSASPALNAIELGNGNGNGVDNSKDMPNSSTPLLAANRSISTSSTNPPANGGPTQASSSEGQAQTTTALSFVSNTAWFVGACVVVGIGMVVGQVRSYRQVQRRSTSTLSSYFATVKRWLRLA